MREVFNNNFVQFDVRITQEFSLFRADVQIIYIYSVSAYTDCISTLTFGLHKNSAYSELTFRLYRVSAYIDCISTMRFGLHRNSACSELTFRLYKVSAYTDFISSLKYILLRI
jgi:hypothetical protein